MLAVPWLKLHDAVNGKIIAWKIRAEHNAGAGGMAAKQSERG